MDVDHKTQAEKILNAGRRKPGGSTPSFIRAEAGKVPTVGPLPKRAGPLPLQGPAGRGPTGEGERFEHGGARGPSMAPGSRSRTYSGGFGSADIRGPGERRRGSPFPSFQGRGEPTHSVNPAPVPRPGRVTPFTRYDNQGPAVPGGLAWPATGRKRRLTDRRTRNNARGGVPSRKRVKAPPALPRPWTFKEYDMDVNPTDLTRRIELAYLRVPYWSKRFSPGRPFVVRRRGPNPSESAPGPARPNP